MKKEKNKKNLRVLVFASILCALTVILSQYASIKIGTSHRIGLGSLPIILAGCFFGPIVGMAVGFVGDLVGCLAYYGLGYWIPLITVGCAMEGLLAGFLGKKLTKPALVLSAFVPHIVGSMIIKSVALWWYYAEPFEVLVWRVPIVLLESVLIAAVLVLLGRNTAIQKSVKRLTK